MARYLDQVPIGSRPRFLILGIQNVHQTAFGSAVVVLKVYDIPLFAALLKQPDQHPHTVIQQAGIPGLMNIGLDNRAIDDPYQTFRLWPNQATLG